MSELRVPEPFNPWRGACGFYPPDVVGRDRTLGLSDGQKRLYERLVRFAGRDGACFPSGDALAAELGKSERQVREDRNRLKAIGLIDWTNRDGGRNNRYVFLWHAIFERQDTAAQVSDEEGLTGRTLPLNGSAPERQDTARDRQDRTFERQDSVRLTGSPLPTNSVHGIQPGNSVHEKTHIPAAPAGESANASREEEPHVGLSMAEAEAMDRDQQQELIIWAEYSATVMDDQFADELELVRCAWLNGHYATFGEALLDVVLNPPDGWSSGWQVSSEALNYFLKERHPGPAEWPPWVMQLPTVQQALTEIVQP